MEAYETKKAPGPSPGRGHDGRDSDRLRGGPGSSAGVTLNASKIESLLEEQGVTAEVTADGDLSGAVAEVAAALAAYTFDQIEGLDVAEMVAQKAGVAPLVCEVYGDSYWVSTPLGYGSRREVTAAGLLDDLGSGAYSVAAARLVSQDGMKLALFVATAA